MKANQILASSATTWRLRHAGVWLCLTVATALLLWLLASCRGVDEATTWIAAGVGVSLVTSLASRATVATSGAAEQPLARLWLETLIRLALPLSVLLALALVRRELLDTPFLLYFLPFQFITLIADTLGAIRRVQTEN